MFLLVPAHVGSCGLSAIKHTYTQIYIVPKIVRMNLKCWHMMVKADWKRWNFKWHLKVDRVSIERMCADREFEVEGADTERAQKEKLLVMPVVW